MGDSMTLHAKMNINGPTVFSRPITTENYEPTSLSIASINLSIYGLSGYRFKESESTYVDVPPSLCQYACTDNSACVGYTIRSGTSAQNGCWISLGFSAAPFEITNEYDSYLIQQKKNSYRKVDRKKITSSELMSFTGLIKNCKAICDILPGCMAFDTVKVDQKIFTCSMKAGKEKADGYNKYDAYIAG
jgi:hypothetical protein